MSAIIISVSSVVCPTGPWKKPRNRSPISSGVSRSPRYGSFFAAPELVRRAERVAEGDPAKQAAGAVQKYRPRGQANTVYPLFQIVGRFVDLAVGLVVVKVKASLGRAITGKASLG